MAQMAKVMPHATRRDDVSVDPTERQTRPSTVVLGPTCLSSACRQLDGKQCHPFSVRGRTRHWRPCNWLTSHADCDHEVCHLQPVTGLARVVVYSHTLTTAVGSIRKTMRRLVNSHAPGSIRHVKITRENEREGRSTSPTLLPACCITHRFKTRHGGGLFVAALAHGLCRRYSHTEEYTHSASERFWHAAERPWLDNEVCLGLQSAVWGAAQRWHRLGPPFAIAVISIPHIQAAIDTQWGIARRHIVGMLALALALHEVDSVIYVDVARRDQSIDQHDRENEAIVCDLDDGDVLCTDGTDDAGVVPVATPIECESTSSAFLDGDLSV
jgi:hypothetical protein